MNKETLEGLIEQNLSTYEIAEKVGKSQTTIRWWLKHFGLKTHIKPFNRGGLARKAKLTKDGRSTLCYCKKCGETDPAKFHLTSKLLTRCIPCHTAANARRYRDNKKRAVEYKGGKCSMCGYNRCMASLDFHHVDSTQKDPNWRRLRSRSFDRIKAELDKCICVCRNCHGEIHFGV